jgi:hypothetical protein
MELLNRKFEIVRMCGWNPFPPFPLFLPGRLLAVIPGWFALVKWLCEKGFFRKTSKFFFAIAVKK